MQRRRGNRSATRIRGEPRRNYGPWALGRDRDGHPLAVVLAESVQLHVHAIRLKRSGLNELAWQHYYGEVYNDAPGVALAHLAIADFDGDDWGEIVCQTPGRVVILRNNHTLVLCRSQELGAGKSAAGR